MYHKIRCDVREWKFWKLFAELNTTLLHFWLQQSTHAWTATDPLSQNPDPVSSSTASYRAYWADLVITINRAPRAFYWWWAVFCFCLHACMFTTDPLKLITSSRSGNHALNIVCLFLFERQIGYRGAVSHCHGCREHAALLSLLNLLVAALRCAIAFWVN